MARSLSFIYLFIILTVSYIGGALLFREWPASSIERVVTLYDRRAMGGAVWYPALLAAGFAAAVLLLSKYGKIRFLIMFIAAVKGVLFGVSSAYLLSAGMKITAYAFWWFPFQLLGCLLFFILCAVLHPPFFTPNLRKQRPAAAVPAVLAVMAAVQLLDIAVYHFIGR